MSADALGTCLVVTTSWDDGHPSDLRVADVLEKHGMSGTFYIPCANSEGRPVMRATEVAQLGRRFEVGGHTQDHVSLTDLAPHHAADQIRGNKDRLEDLLGREVPGFAYVRGRYNRTVRRLVEEAGFRYARTVKNLMSTPGSSPFEVPTTAQFFYHKKSVYIRNYLSGGPTSQRAAILSSVLVKKGLIACLSNAAETCFRSGGYFHLWGHSWELDEHCLWDDLDRFLTRLRQPRSRFVTNAEWIAASAGAPRHGFEKPVPVSPPACRSMREYSDF